MEKTVITKIRLSENIDLPAFYGSHDANLKLMEELFDVRVVARGDELSVEGAAEAVEKIENLIADINEMAEGGFSLKHEDVAFAINSVKREPKVSVKKVFLDTIPVSSKKRFITPRSANQRKYVEAIRRNDIVIGIGPAGTGKTYLAMAMAVSALVKKEVSRIVLARPAVEAGEKLGFLPGDIFEKVHPYLRPLYDALFDMMEFDKANRLIERGTIEIAPLAFMRGRTLNDSFVILDEAQNATSEQMKMFLTRLGFNSKAVVTGDITQVDLPRERVSGLIEIQEILSSVKGIKFVYFSERDVVRHKLVQQIVKAYERHLEKIGKDKGDSRR
ncbi:MAG: PhoH family protein [Nitrospirota bacterium]